MFGPGFLEKVSKRIEVDQEKEKVSTPSHKGGPVCKKAKYENDKLDLHSFFYSRAPLQSMVAENYIQKNLIRYSCHAVWYKLKDLKGLYPFDGPFYMNSYGRYMSCGK